MAGPRYLADADVLAVAAEMEGLTIVFHQASGQTHILAPPAPQILAALAGDAGDEEQILSRIGADFDLAPAAPAALAARLAELEAAGLVHRP
ncbi:MAG: HPr-rel-A system PqqD family peptide chaperone [Alphaproteobacteria bacterium]|nr:HPr-rel-A system PqqD family peptide chaperone [Alphaproteobacteria bacterium]